jgi:hypothetical protein
MSTDGAILLRAIEKLEAYIKEMTQAYRDGLGGGGCRAFCELRTVYENVVRSTIRFHGSARSRLQDWQAGVSSGKQEYDPATYEGLREVFRAWLALAQQLADPPALAGRAGDDLAPPRLLSKLRECVAETDRLLTTWGPIMPGLELNRVAQAIKDLDAGKGVLLEEILARLT